MPHGAAKESTQHYRYSRPITLSYPTASSRDAAHDAAERRWTAELTRILAGDERRTAAVADMMTNEVKLAAPEAELSKDGSGAPFVRSRLNRQLPGSRGPAQ